MTGFNAMCVGVQNGRNGTDNVAAAKRGQRTDKAALQAAFFY